MVFIKQNYHIREGGVHCWVEFWQTLPNCFSKWPFWFIIPPTLRLFPQPHLLGENILYWVSFPWIIFVFIFLSDCPADSHFSFTDPVSGPTSASLLVVPLPQSPHWTGYLKHAPCRINHSTTQFLFNACSRLDLVTCHQYLKSQHTQWRQVVRIPIAQKNEQTSRWYITYSKAPAFNTVSADLWSGCSSPLNALSVRFRAHKLRCCSADHFNVQLSEGPRVA